MEGHPRERSALGWEAGAPLPHPFFVSTEKQRSRDLPGLPNLEPGEGEMGGVGFRGEKIQRSRRVGARGQQSVCLGETEAHRF